MSTFQPLHGNQLALTPNPPQPRRADTCPHCRQPVRHIIDNPTLGQPATVTRHPIDRAVALAAIAYGGRRAYLHKHHRHTSTWTFIDQWRITNPNLAGDWHLNHVCGKDPDPPPRTPTPTPAVRDADADTPPF